MSTEFSMTPELTILIDQKEDAVAAALADNNTNDKTPLLEMGEKNGGYGATK